MLQRSYCGCTVYNISRGIIALADDIALVSNRVVDLQTMLEPSSSLRYNGALTLFYAKYACTL